LIGNVGSLNGAERIGRQAGGIVALIGLLLAIPGMARSVRASDWVSGRPELVFRPSRLPVISVGWFATMGSTWRPLPIRPGPNARVLMLVAGTSLYLAGMTLAVVSRLALGSSYRPSSTLGLSLAPKHRLVTTGPFALVRHPMYVGLCLAAFGALLLYRTWACLLLLAQLPVLVVRASQEDELLSRAFADEWRSYAQRVNAWLPRASCPPCAEVGPDLGPKERPGSV